MDLYQVCSNYDPGPPSLFKLWPWGQKWSCPKGPHVLHRLMENMNKSSCMKPQIIEPWYLIWSITSTNFVQVILLRPKMFPPQWSHDLLFYIGFNKENLKKSSCLKLQGLEPWYLVCSITSNFLIFLSSAVFFKINLLYSSQRVKQFGFRSGPIFCFSWFGSKSVCKGYQQTTIAGRVTSAVFI